VTATRSARRTLANLSDWPGAKIEALAPRCLRGDAVAPGRPAKAFVDATQPASWPCRGGGWGTLRKLGLDRLLSQGGRQPADQVALCVAMIVCAP